MNEAPDSSESLSPPLSDAARLLAREVPVSPSVLSNVMASLESRPVPRRALVHRLLGRRTLRASPIQIGLLAASIACAGVLVGRYSADRADSPVSGESHVPRAVSAAAVNADATGLVTIAVEVHSGGVRFVLNAPQVRHVALVGDFNGWRPDATPLTRDPSTGLWSVDLPVSAGRYNYAFVVDGRWTADPQSPRAPDDDFGRPNSVLVVNREASRS